MKKIALIIAVYMLSGCALYDAYFMAKYDTNEYAAIAQLRTQAEVAQETCADKKITEQHISSMFNTATYFKNFTQLRARNEETSTIAYNLYLITDQLKKHYEKNETVSGPYCKLKLQQIEKNAITAQKVIGSKPR